MKTALLVIDAQRIYTSLNSELACKGASQTISNINTLIKHFRKANEPIIFVRHEHDPSGKDAGYLFDFQGSGESEDIGFLMGTDDVKLDSRLDYSESDVSVVKHRYSAFVNTELTKILRSRKIERVTVCGFMTNFCCESTARHAFDLDFLVDFVSDATGTPGTDDYSQKQLRTMVGRLLGAGFASVYASTKRYLARA